MRFLWLKSELLHPLDKGGKIRTYQMLKHLRAEHEVTYLSLAAPALSGREKQQAEEYCHRLVPIPYLECNKSSARFYTQIVANLGSPLPYAIEKYRSRQMRREIERELRSSSYDVVVCDFLVPSINLPHTGNTPALLFQHNVESVIWRRHFENQRSTVRRAYFYTQYEKMIAYERNACHRFDAVIAVSEADRDHMREQFGVERVYAVPTGVDTDYFQPRAGATNASKLVFTGSMDWMPNSDGVLNFIETVFPRIRAARPDVTLTIVGRNPSRQLRSLARISKGIEITGRVDDIRPFVHNAAVYVVPLRIGGGTRIKVFEAMAMGKAIVSTTVGAEGLPVRNGRDLLIADGPEQFADSVLRLLKDRALQSSLGAAGRDLVCNRFGWENAASVFASICERVAGHSKNTRAA